MNFWRIKLTSYTRDIAWYTTSLWTYVLPLLPIAFLTINLRLYLFMSKNQSETSAKPHIDIKIINITHWLSIVAFRYKKTFAEASKQLELFAYWSYPELAYWYAALTVWKAFLMLYRVYSPIQVSNSALSIKYATLSNTLAVSIKRSSSVTLKQYMVLLAKRQQKHS